MSKIKNIRNLYEQISKKEKFILMLENDLKLDYDFLKLNYFRNGFNIPDNHQDRIIDLLQKTIRLQRIKKSRFN